MQLTNILLLGLWTRGLRLIPTMELVNCGGQWAALVASRSYKHRRQIATLAKANPHCSKADSRQLREPEALSRWAERVFGPVPSISTDSDKRQLCLSGLLRYELVLAETKLAKALNLCR